MAPAVIVVMGVSGCGKTTIASRLAERLRWRFAEADSFHPLANIAKMRSGVALTDEDRSPWLDAIALWIESVRASGQKSVITCSALKRSYRERLTRGHGDVRFVYLKGDYALIAARIVGRQGHYMPLALLQSQFDTLEEPGADENALVASIERPPEEIIAGIGEALGLRTALLAPRP